jgi:hypothetical protein
MDEEDFLGVLEDLHAVLSPVANSGASRDELVRAVRGALDIIADVEEELEEVDQDEEDEEEDEGPDQEEEEEKPHDVPV